MFDGVFWSSKAIAFSCSFASFDSFPKYIDRIWKEFEEKNLLDKCSLWNVNIPDKVEGIAYTKQGGAYVQDHFYRVEGDLWTQRGYYLEREREEGGYINKEGIGIISDIEAIEKKSMISITPMIIDRTDYTTLKSIKDEDIVL